MSILGPRGRSGPLHTTTAYARPADEKSITRKRLEADMDAFDRAGGKVELLGVTPLRRKEKKAAPPAAKGDAKVPGDSGRK